jgi:hypothetical protein
MSALEKCGVGRLPWCMSEALKVVKGGGDASSTAPRPRSTHMDPRELQDMIATFMGPELVRGG